MIEQRARRWRRHPRGPESGWQITYPAEGYHEIFIAPDSSTPNVDFGNISTSTLVTPRLPMPRSLSMAVHPTAYCRASIWAKWLTPNPMVSRRRRTGDDLHNLADEDGVQLAGPLFAGFTASVDVTVNTGGYRDRACCRPGSTLMRTATGMTSVNRSSQTFCLDDGVHTMTSPYPLGVDRSAIRLLASDTATSTNSVPRVTPPRAKWKTIWCWCSRISRTPWMIDLRSPRTRPTYRSMCWTTISPAQLAT